MTRTSADRFPASSFSPLELAALDWLDGFYQLEHLLCARKWVIKLFPSASPELKFAALVHDAERFFPGGPSSMPTDGFDNADYLFVHSMRSADIVENWLRARTPAVEDSFIRRVRALILRHEIGGNFEEDVLQAADSLSFIEVYDWLALEWLRSGQYTVADVRSKWDWMLERMRISSGLHMVLPFYRQALGVIHAAGEYEGDLAADREAAGRKVMLLNIAT